MPCAVKTLEKYKDIYDITAYYYNYNITEKAEYDKRLAEFRGNYPFRVKVVDAGYSPFDFFKDQIHMKGEEGGERCSICYERRLIETAKFAVKNNIKKFGTSIVNSPHKNRELIEKLGEKIARKFDLEFFSDGFSEKQGFSKTDQDTIYKDGVAITKKFNIYRQNFCGCIISKIKNADEVITEPV